MGRGFGHICRAEPARTRAVVSRARRGVRGPLALVFGNFSAGPPRAFQHAGLRGPTVIQRRPTVGPRRPAAGPRRSAP